jgi:hypothetical protein
MWLAIAGRYLSARTFSITALAHSSDEVALATDMVGRGSAALTAE